MASNDLVNDYSPLVSSGSEVEGMSLVAELYVALYTASRAMNSSYRPLLASLGLTHTQYLVMLVLWDQRVVTVGELGDRLHLSTGTVSPLLTRLEQAGLVSRRRRRDDIRTAEVSATQMGLRLRAAAAYVPAAIARACGLTATETAELRNALQVMTMRLSTAELRAGGAEARRAASGARRGPGGRTASGRPGRDRGDGRECVGR